MLKLQANTYFQDPARVHGQWGSHLNFKVHLPYHFQYQLPD